VTDFHRLWVGQKHHRLSWLALYVAKSSGSDDFDSLKREETDPREKNTNRSSVLSKPLKGLRLEKQGLCSKHRLWGLKKGFLCMERIVVKMAAILGESGCNLHCKNHNTPLATHKCYGASLLCDATIAV